MKQRINIAWLLMMVCMIMLTASVLPHHHHKGLLCLQHDATEKECSAPVEQDSHNSSTCKACCYEIQLCTSRFGRLHSAGLYFGIGAFHID